MERKVKIVLLTAVSILTVVGLSAVAYARTTETSFTDQCGFTRGSGGMGSMGGMNHMGMGQSGCALDDCGSMMSPYDTPQCKNVVPQTRGIAML